MYPDMPWMVSGDSSMDELRTSIGQVWGTRAAWRSRLFAFGYDACQLMLAMSALAERSGLTCASTGSPGSCTSMPTAACSAI